MTNMSAFIKQRLAHSKSTLVSATVINSHCQRLLIKGLDNILDKAPTIFLFTNETMHLTSTLMFQFFKTHVNITLTQST